MNKMKRLFSFVLAFAIVLGAFVPFADVVLAEEATTEAATEEAKKDAAEKPAEEKKEEVKEEAKPVVPEFTDFLKAVPSDVVGTDAEAAVRRLVAFGVLQGYPDGTFKPGNELSRAEFAKMAVLGLGLADAQEATTQNATRFPDVPTHHWASGYINIASSQGLIIGFTDGTFRPNAKVTYAQAVTIITRALGYDDSILKGQWPENYLSKANEIKLTSAAAVPVNYNTFIVRGDAAKLLDKGLHTKVVEPVQYEGSTVVSRLLDKLLMTKTMGITQNKDARIVGDQYVDRNLKDLEANMLVEKDNVYTAKKISLERAAANYKRFVGEKATVYLDKDDVAVYIEGREDVNSEFDYVVDAKSVRDGFDLELAAHDGKFELSNEAVVYVMDNDEDVYTMYVRDKDIERALDAKLAIDANVNNLKDRVGKVVVEGGKVVYAELTRQASKLVAPEFLVVTEVTDKQIKGISGNGVVDFSVDFSKDSKYDGIYVFDQDGVKKEVKDIKKGDVAYIQEQYFNRGDQLFVQVVQGKNVTGEVGRTKADSVVMGDKEYKVLEDVALVADGVYGNVSLFKDNAKDLYREDAVLYLGAGGLGVLLGNADEDFVSGYGVLVEVGYRGNAVTIVHEKDGKLVEETYRLSGRDSLEDGYLNVLHEKDGDYVVNEKAKLSDIISGSNNIENLAGQPVRFRLTNDSRIVENTLVFLDKGLRQENPDAKFFKEAVLVGGFAGKVADKAQVIEAFDLDLAAVNKGMNRVRPSISDEFALLDYAKDLAKSERSGSLGVAVFPSRVGKVQAIVLYNKGLDAVKDMDDADESIFVKDISRRGGTEEVTYVSFESGESKTNDWTSLRNEKTFEKNNVYVANVDRRGRLVKSTDDKLEVKTATVKSVDARRDTITTTTANEELIVLDGALVYNNKGSRVLVRDLKAGEEINFIRIVDTKFVTALVVDPKDKADVNKMGVLEYLNSTRAIVDGERFVLDADTLLKDDKGNIVAIGGNDIREQLKTGVLKLDDTLLEVKNNVITIKGSKAEVENDKKVEEAKKALEVQFAEGDNKDKVTQDVTLAEDLGDVNVAWEVTEGTAMTDAGTVIRPTFTEGDAKVTLKATLTLGDAEATKEFVLTVKAKDATAEEKFVAGINKAKDAVEVKALLDAATDVQLNAKYTGTDVEKLNIARNVFDLRPTDGYADLAAINAIIEQ